MTGAAGDCCVEGRRRVLTAPKPRAVSLLSVYLAVKPVGEPDAGDRHVRFDERGWETERCRMAQATAPILDSTFATYCTATRPRSLSGDSGNREAAVYRVAFICDRS